jgi:hypothetical protein
MKWLREQIKNYPCEQSSYLSTNDKKEETIRFETLFKEYDFVTKADEDTRNQFAKENENAINRTVIEMFDSYKFDDIKNLNILFKINQTLISESKKTITLNKLLGDETVHSWHNNLDLLQSYAECFSTKNEDEAIQAYVAKCIEQNNYKNIRAISKIPRYTEPLTKITSIAYHELAQEDPVSFDKLIQATKIIPDQAETALAYDVCANKGNFESMQSIIEKTNLEPNEKNLVNLTDVLIEEEKWETLTSFIKKHTIPEDKIQLAYQKMIKAEKYTALKDLCALSNIELSKKTYNCFTTNIGGSK